MRITAFLRRPSVEQAALEHLRDEQKAALLRDSFDRRVRTFGRRASDIGNWCYSGTVKVMQFPAYVFDLLDRYGKPDHSKIGPFLVSQELIALQAYDVIANKRPLQAAIVIIIAVLSFASMSLMRKFLDKSKVEIASSTSIEESRKTVQVTQRLIAERHIEDGSPPRSMAATGALVPE